MKYWISALAICLFCSAGARGSTIVAVQSVTAAAGGAGAFDISLTNTGSSAPTFGASTFGISNHKYGYQLYGREHLDRAGRLYFRRAFVVRA